MTLARVQAHEALTPIVIRMAGEPQGKGRPRFDRRTARAYTPTKTRTYGERLTHAAQQAVGEHWTPVEGALAVTVVAVVPIPASWAPSKWRRAMDGLITPEKKPDWDNYAKQLDALNQVVWKDDKQVIDGRVVKLYGDSPSLTIIVKRPDVAALLARYGADVLLKIERAA